MMSEIILSATSAALLFALALYLLYRERSAANVGFVVLLVLLSAIELSCRLLTGLPHLLIGYEKVVLFIESLLPATLLFFCFTYGRPGITASRTSAKRISLIATLIFPVGILAVPLRSFFYSPDIHTERILFLGDVGYWYYMGVLLCCIIALVSLETVFSATSDTDRQKIKLEVIGIGSILAVLIFYFSQGLLYRTLNLNLLPARSGIFIIAALMIGYSRLRGRSAANIVVSRYVLYRSLTLLFVGIYFIFIGILGEGMKYIGAPFGKDLLIFISFIAGIIMIIIFLSETLRRKIKVFINKHFYAHKYDYREKWLAFTGRLALCRTLTDVLNVIVTTFAVAFGLNGASIYLFNKDKNVYSLAVNQDMPEDIKELRISSGMASYFRDRGRVLNTRDGEYVPTEDEVRFLSRSGANLVVALIANDIVEGIIVCGAQLATEKFIYEDYDLMKIIARQATLSIVNFRLSEELAETREMAAVAKISSFIIHDLKNQAYSLSLLLENAEAFIENAEFQKDMIETIRNTAAAMKNIIDKLKRIPEKNTLDREPVDLSLLAGETVKDLNKFSGSSGISLESMPVYAMIDAEEIKKVIVNIILNAIDATSGKGCIAVMVGSDSEYAFIRVADDGCGMSEEYIVGSLFKPFRSTKKSGLGIGLYQCRQIIGAHCGRIEVRSGPDKGSTFTVYLPKQTAEAQL